MSFYVPFCREDNKVHLLGYVSFASQLTAKAELYFHMLKRNPSHAMLSGYARMWPRAVFYTKALNLEIGRERNLAKR